MKLEVMEDMAAVAQRAAVEVELRIRAQLKRADRFSLALSGGSTPRAFHKVLAESYLEQIPWSKVDLFLSDERALDPQDQDSNHRMVQDTLLLPLGDHKPIFHTPLGIAEDAAKAAAEYESKLLDTTESGACDLVMLGMGGDGHTASLFPGFETPTGLIASVRAPKETAAQQRVSFTYEALSRAKTLMVLICGASKAKKLAEILDDNQDYPLTRVLGQNQGDVIIIADRAASARLKNRQEMK